MLEQRDALDLEQRAAADRKIQKLLFSCTLYHEAKEIFIYVSFRSEADTRMIIRKALADGKKVAVPKIVGKRNMEFYYIRGMEDLCVGNYGIEEPRFACGEPAVPSEQTMMILPGAAFDGKGNRIGYGGGYYDAYLHRHPCKNTVALAYEVQCVSCLPAEIHDIRTAAILTEKRMMIC